MEKEHLLGKTLEELQTVAEVNGLPRFAAKQIASWLYEKRIDHIAGMSNLSLKHRELLSQRYDIAPGGSGSVSSFYRWNDKISFSGRGR